MRKDTLGIILAIVGAGIGFLGAFTAQGDIDNVQLFTLLVVFLTEDIDTLRLMVILIMFMMTSDTGWYLIYAGLGCALLGGIIAAVD
ncbi:MAG: hypothetical protein HWN67_06690 [Candidatus Helarchaeota archaeon]|nr:hypothetical protein [Candidatus Helarchaeota archaeon]